MGGTSTDCALIPRSNTVLWRETVNESLRVTVQSVDVRTVGADVSSIALYNDLTTSLRVGPKSAGTSSGPAAYSKGKTQASAVFCLATIITPGISHVMISAIIFHNVLIFLGFLIFILALCLTHLPIITHAHSFFHLLIRFYKSRRYSSPQLSVGWRTP